MFNIYAVDVQGQDLHTESLIVINHCDVVIWVIVNYKPVTCGGQPVAS